MTTTDPRITRYQTILDGMTDAELVDEFEAEVWQFAKAEFGSDVWEAGLTTVPMVRTALLARLAATR